MNEADYALWQFLLNRRRGVARIEGVELSDPSFSRTYYLLHRWRKPMTLTHEDGQAVLYEPCPMRLTPMGASGDLDYGVKVTLGDLGQILPDEIDRKKAAGTMGVRPTARFRTWRSDDLSKPLILPARLEIGEVSRNIQGATFDAVAPRLNLVRTGEVQTVERFPMLRGFFE